MSIQVTMSPFFQTYGSDLGRNKHEMLNAIDKYLTEDKHMMLTVCDTTPQARNMPCRLVCVCVCVCACVCAHEWVFVRACMRVCMYTEAADILCAFCMCTFL